MERRLRLFADASTMLAGSVDIRATLRDVARMLVPTIADWCTVAVLEEDGVVRRIAGVHADPARAAAMAEYLQRFEPTRHRISTMADAVREGRSFFMPHVDASWLESAAQDSEHLRVLQALGC